MDSESPLTRRELLSCMELGKALTSTLDAQQLLQVILEKVSELLPAENWSLLLVDEATDELHFQVSVDLDPDLVRSVRLAPGEGIAGQAVLRREPLVVPDVTRCDYFHSRVDELTGFKTESVICVPLIFGGRSLGVIEVVNPRNLKDGALALLSLVADYAAIAVENTRRYRRIQDLAVQDNLTGLYNTRYLYQALTELTRPGASGAPFALIFMDLDDFKQVVDAHGHLNGSRALQEVAATIRESLEEPGFGVSYGGDEFVVVLPGATRDWAAAKAEEIRARMKKTAYLARWGLKVSLAASFGLAAFPDDADNLTDLLALADRAMFGVKRTGKDAVASG